GMLKAEITVVFRTHGASFNFDSVVAIDDPLMPQRRQSMTDVAAKVRITPHSPVVVNTNGRVVFHGNFTQRNQNFRMQATLNVDAFARGKSGVEVGGIVEFELGCAHRYLPSSVLPESGSRVGWVINYYFHLRIPIPESRLDSNLVGRSNRESGIANENGH